MCEVSPLCESSCVPLSHIPVQTVYHRQSMCAIFFQCGPPCDFLRLMDMETVCHIQNICVMSILCEPSRLSNISLGQGGGGGMDVTFTVLDFHI